MRVTSLNGYNNTTCEVKILFTYALHELDRALRCANIHNAHSYDELLHVCIKIIDTPYISGDIVEFGCYSGASTAKLSLTSNFVNKKLVVFDSFEGLPDPQEYGAGHQKIIYAKGAYASDINNTINNVINFGCPTHVSFMKTWFKDLEEKYNKSVTKISHCLIDVDLVKSFCECIEFVLPRLSKGGTIFSHEANDVEMIKLFKEYGLMSDNFIYEHITSFDANNKDTIYKTDMIMFTKIK